MAGLFNIFQKDTKSQTEDVLISLVQTRAKNADSVLLDYHRQWFVNIAMRRGLQYVQTSASSGVVINPPDQEDRVRMTINKMSGIHQTRVAKLIKDMPKLDVIPASSQDEDKDLARKGTKLLSWLWENEKMVQKIIDNAEWCVDTGNCFFYVYWDADKGDDIPTYKRHEGPITVDMLYRIDQEGYVLDKMGQRIPETITTGDVAVDLIDPFCIINDGVHTDIQDSNWIIIRQAMSLKDIRSKWPDRGGDVKSETELNTRAYYQRRLMALVGNQSTYFTPEAKQQEEMAVVDIMFERKSDEFPLGRRAVTANGVLLEAGDMPFKHGLYPLVKFSDISISGAFWDMGTMENCVPIQKGFNRTWSQILENGNALGNIKAWVNKGHGMTKDAYDDTGFEILELNQGFEVNQLQPATLPSHITNQLQWYDKAFEDVTGQHETTNAQVPAGVTAASAIMQLQEQDDTRLAPTKMRFYKSIEEVGYQALELYAEFQEEDREYQIIGSSALDIDEFKIKKDEIKSMKKDVRVQTENIIGSHKTLQQEAVVTLYEKRLFGDPENPEVKKKVLQLLEFGNVAEIFDEADLDANQARKENEQFINSTGLQKVDNPDFDPNAPNGTSPAQVFSVPAYDFENHEIHILQHNKLRKSARYRQMTDEMRKGLDLHVKMHEIFEGKVAPKQPTPEAPEQAAPAPGVPPQMNVVHSMGAVPPPAQ